MSTTQPEALPRYREYMHLRTTGAWSDGVPAWAKDYSGRMNDMTAAHAVIEELHARVEALSAAQAGVPDGYALVPVEPTPEMLSEIWVHKNGSLSEAYRAMLAAAPQPVVREPLTDEAARKQGANHD